MIKIFLGIVFFQLMSYLYADVLKCHLSDRWYPSRGKILRQKMNDMNLKARHQYKNNFDARKIKAIIVPHAGFNYSGILASGVYQNLKPKIFDRVIVLAPSHDLYFRGVALPDIEYASYKSPIRQIQIDQYFLKKLKKLSSLFAVHHQAHELEHAIEIQIPFIQKYCGFCKIVPLLIGDVNFLQIQEIADALHECMNQKTLIIVSSDLTHYGSMFHFTPFHHDILNHILQLDQKLIESIVKIQPQKFLKIIENTGDPVCGKNSIAILMMMIQKKYFENVECVLVGYDRSSQEIDVQNCVSYIGMIVTS